MRSNDADDMIACGQERVPDSKEKVKRYHAELRVIAIRSAVT